MLETARISQSNPIDLPLLFTSLEADDPVTSRILGGPKG
jgi:hypothetical protein